MAIAACIIGLGLVPWSLGHLSETSTTAMASNLLRAINTLGSA
jgi:hypothetical protein